MKLYKNTQRNLQRNNGNDKINKHAKVYKILVNGIQLSFLHSVESVSDKYIEYSKQDCITRLKKNGRIKDNDKVEFVFKYCTFL